MRLKTYNKGLDMKKIVALIVALIFGACSNNYKPLPTVEKVDLNRYSGTWFEIARYDQYFERGCSNISATYSLRDDGQINVLNSCTKEDGRLAQANGIAYAVDDSKAKLKVSFFRPFYGDYHILLLDKDYKYVVIGEPSRKYFWILSRTRLLDDSIRDSILEKMPELGYDSKLLIWPEHK